MQRVPILKVHYNHEVVKAMEWSCTMEAPDDTPRAYLGSFSQPSLAASTPHAALTCPVTAHTLTPADTMHGHSLSNA